jgi:hypothetical protein
MTCEPSVRLSRNSSPYECLLPRAQLTCRSCLEPYESNQFHPTSYLSRSILTFFCQHRTNNDKFNSAFMKLQVFIREQQITVRLIYHLKRWKYFYLAVEQKSRVWGKQNVNFNENVFIIFSHFGKESGKAKRLVTLI